MIVCKSLHHCNGNCQSMKYEDRCYKRCLFFGWHEVLGFSKDGRGDDYIYLIDKVSNRLMTVPMKKISRVRHMSRFIFWLSNRYYSR